MELYPVSKADKVNSTENQISRKSRLAALLFGIFLGTIGVHDFYLGKKNRGIWHIILTVLSTILYTNLLNFKTAYSTDSIILTLILFSLLFTGASICIGNFIWTLVEWIEIAKGNGKDSEGKNLKQWIWGVNSEEEEISPKDYLTSLLLGIFLGRYGIENFYLGKTKKALIQLISGLIATAGFLYTYKKLSWIQLLADPSRANTEVIILAVIKLISSILFYLTGLWKGLDWIRIASNLYKDYKNRRVIYLKKEKTENETMS